MTAAPDNRKTVLFVDDDTAFLDLFCQVMEVSCRGAWDIHSASNAGRAISLLQSRPFDLLVIDARMPVVDGLQLLRLVKVKHPQLPKAILTGGGNLADRKTCLEMGADLYLEKPVTSGDMESIFAALQLLMHNEPEEGFRGEMRRIGLQDVLQMECLGAKSSIVDVQVPDGSGQIYLRDGNVIHAQCRDLAGPAAFFRLLALKGGTFRIMPFAAPETTTIFASWEGLLMEAATRRDETTTESRPPRPAEPAAPPRAPALPAGTLLSRRTEETLVCTGRGEIAHQAGCADAGARREMLEGLRAHATELGGLLGSGATRWVELQRPGSRATAMFPGAALVFVETRPVVRSIPAAA